MSNSQAQCYCRTCKRAYHYMGIARHRAMHRDRREDCEIVFSDGVSKRWNYSELARRLTQGE